MCYEDVAIHPHRVIRILKGNRIINIVRDMGSGVVFEAFAIS